MIFFNYSGLFTHLIGSTPFAIRKLFVRENGRDPKKPREALSGEGCGDVITK